MGLSIYVHIPYCLQRCRYCDFTTFEQSEILPAKQYVDWVLQEIRTRHPIWPERGADHRLETLYFGGGTPSLLSPDLIVAICEELANVGFVRAPTCELTLEINPATLTEEHLNTYLKAGFNRFSVGAQTFNDRLLKICGRKHTAADTWRTLDLLRKYELNYSFDLLFALPTQTLSDLEQDLRQVVELQPPHVSPYCLTVPEGHPMNTGRAPEGEQVEMFERIDSTLTSHGLERYEISNFARPGFESRHNQAYWQDQSFWGIGLSAHSYAKHLGPFGTRFWNAKSLAAYAEQLRLTKVDRLPPEQWETLKRHEALTDFCHTRLRTEQGLSWAELSNKFGLTFDFNLTRKIEKIMQKLVGDGLLRPSPQGLRWALTAEGRLLSNVVFEALTFDAAWPESLQAEPLTVCNADS